jgi:transitional endoplasmic reticulum ATPase
MMLCHFDSNLTHYFSGKMRRDTALICLNSDDVEEGHIQVNKVARNNLCLKLADLVNVHQCLDITYGKRVHLLPFEDSVEGLSGDIFDMDIRPYFPEDKQSCHYLILDALSEHHFM